ncbi:16S rRNA (uracil(1498)-N(3))-methyltransferase [Candidatus Uhrbacteria bacterium]|nr:16S rRNA (uracil(1498)-N(3))-methyltransferase [Candidatus Uhrbacteria bacterium]
MITNARQFHIDPSAMNDDAVIMKVGELYKQMTSVLRLHTGDQVRFFDGVGNVADCTIAHIGKDGIIAKVDSSKVQPRGREMTLAIGILKKDRMRWVLEKATELGVWNIVPMITDRVIKRPETTPPRWKLIVKEAAEQCGRAWLPQVEGVQTFQQVLESHNEVVLCSSATQFDIGECPKNVNTLLIGPEGGFTDEETRVAESLGACIASLGDHQLRADTAVVVALSKL